MREGSAAPTGRRLGSILAGSAGNLVEMYDWFAYASFSLYFAKAFFPDGDQTVQLLNAAAVFGVGFFARPVGAWIMGIYADRAGRRAAMMASILMMCGGSLIIALCPGYATIGIAAPAVLVLARLGQGFSFGAEYGTTATYLLEMSGRRHRGFWSGFFYATLMAGQLLALATLIGLQALLSPAALEAWGWRVPFLIGGALAAAVFWLRRGMSETPSFEAMAGARPSPLLLFVRYPREALVVVGLTAAGTLGFYVFSTYMQKFLVNTSGFSKVAATQVTAAALVVFMLIQLPMGALSEWIGRRNMLIAFGVLGTLGSWPMLWALARVHDPLAAFALIVLALAVVTLHTSVNAIVKAEMFPTEVRALGVSLPYAIGTALFGGSAEYIALWFKKARAESGFFTYVTVVMAASLLVYLFIPDTRRHSRILED